MLPEFLIAFAIVTSTPSFPVIPICNVPISTNNIEIPMSYFKALKPTRVKRLINKAFNQHLKKSEQTELAVYILAVDSGIVATEKMWLGEIEQQTIIAEQFKKLYTELLVGSTTMKGGGVVK